MNTKNFYLLNGLSNFINAACLYDETLYISYGKNEEWKEHDWFSKNILSYFQAITIKDAEISEGDLSEQEEFERAFLHRNWSDDDLAKIYLINSKTYDADLFIDLTKANKLQKEPIIDDWFIKILKYVDENIKKEADFLWSDDIKIGIEKNFSFPSLTHYILFQATSISDLFRVIMQFRASGEIRKVKQKINDIFKSTQGAAKFQNEVEFLIQKYFYKESYNNQPWSLSLNVLFMTITKSFSVNKINKVYKTFLKDIIASRAEAFNLNEQVNRLFKREINLDEVKYEMFISNDF